MKRFLCKFIALALAVTAIVTLAGCDNSSPKTDIGIAAAQGKLTDYLKDKGFGGDDFLSEGEKMSIDGVNVYVFSWRMVENEYSDRLFGTYAISVDGNSFYEYQAERGDWIKDMRN